MGGQRNERWLCRIHLFSFQKAQQFLCFSCPQKKSVELFLSPVVLYFNAILSSFRGRSVPSLFFRGIAFCTEHSASEFGKDILELDLQVPTSQRQRFFLRVFSPQHPSLKHRHKKSGILSVWQLPCCASSPVHLYLVTRCSLQAAQSRDSLNQGGKEGNEGAKLEEGELCSVTHLQDTNVSLGKL